MTEILLGTSAFTAEGWAGSFYPASSPKEKSLVTFDTIRGSLWGVVLHGFWEKNKYVVVPVRRLIVGGPWRNKMPLLGLVAAFESS
jgi:hypothetical protein